MTIERIVDIAIELDWKVDLSEQDNRNGGVDKIASFYQYSPAGEDFGFDVFYEDADDLVRKIDEYHEGFDVDEYIEMWIEAKKNGVAGVPSTRELVKDAEDINEMLKTLSDKIREVKTNEQRRICHICAK